MTDEAQADLASMPDEAENDTEVLAQVPSMQPEEYDNAPADSEHAVSANPDWIDDKHVKEALSMGVAPANIHPAKPEETEPQWVKQRPPFILSFVDTDHKNGGFVIGWDTCGACNLHIRTCTCPDGPVQPSYVKRWRSKDDTKHDKPYLTAPAKKAVVAADPEAVEKAVSDVLNDTSDGYTPVKTRKKRSDAGQPRGPRTKGTPDSVLAAAGDLATAMNKES